MPYEDSQSKPLISVIVPAWFTRMMMMIPFVSRPFWEALAFCDAQLDKRMQKKVVVPDIMSTLLEPFRDGHKPTSEEMAALRGDMQQIIFAGG